MHRFFLFALVWLALLIAGCAPRQWACSAPSQGQHGQTTVEARTEFGARSSGQGYDHCTAKTEPREVIVGEEYAGVTVKRTCATMIALRVTWKPPIHDGGFSLEVFHGRGPTRVEAEHDAWVEWFAWRQKDRQTISVETVSLGLRSEVNANNPNSVTRCWTGDAPADVKAWPSNGSHSKAAYARWTNTSWSQDKRDGPVRALNPNCQVWRYGEQPGSNYTKYNGWSWVPAATNASTHTCRVELHGREQIRTSDGWELGSEFVIAMERDNICGPETHARSNAETSLRERAPANFIQRDFVGACWPTGSRKPDQPSGWSGKDGAW